MTNPTEEVKKAAADATAAAQAAASQTERTLTTVLRDGAYATVGASDVLLKSALTFAGRLGTVREAPEHVRHFAEELPERARQLASVDLPGLRSSVESEFDEFVSRGRAVVESIQHSRPTEEATRQTKVAKSQVKAAATSLRTAAESTAGQARHAVGSTAEQARHAVGSTAEQARHAVGSTAEQARHAAEGLREVAEDRGKAASSQAKAAQTSVTKAAEAAGDAAADAAQKVGNEQPLEELPVVELRKLAKERNIYGRTGMNKAELIRALS